MLSNYLENDPLKIVYSSKSIIFASWLINTYTVFVFEIAVMTYYKY